jgi:hypothetical protein
MAFGFTYDRTVNKYDGKNLVPVQERTTMPAIGSLCTTSSVIYYASKPGWKLVSFELPQNEQFSEVANLCRMLIQGAVAPEVAQAEPAIKAKVAEVQAKMGR